MVPKLRFHFNDSILEKTTLQVITDGIGDGIHATPAYQDDGDYFFINGNNLNNGSLTLSENTKKISLEEKEKYRDNLNERSILLSINGTIGNIAYYDNEPVLLGKSVAYINVSNSYCKEWVYFTLQGNSVLKYFEQELTGSTIKNLSLKSIRNTVIYLPNFYEQKKIGDFLSSVDEKITLLNKQYDLLCQYKKGMMQKIFSQELRFKDKNGEEFPEWKRQKLGDVATFLKGKGVAKADIIECGERECIRYGELYTEYSEVINKIKSKTNQSVFDSTLSVSRDVLIPSSGETAIDISKASCVLNDGVILGGDLNIIRSNVIDGVFLSYYINSKKRYEIAQMAQGNSVVHLYAKQLAEIDVFYPCKKEQMKISNFLSAFDEKIAVKKAELDKLTTWKQGLLQQMFV
ncbi:restriction endonuclease subunit S [Pectobacterium brasiliense]|uniref:restriction endonuclease subunit S n=1 Tax=Pectobacterium brasiliense TaxID=180957 RepID=UPI002A81EBBF|nr:restriction endonuclease subunit S [Pectobacterium brasiliense]MDY4335688.1 restriction endonuclease subunit S [Pectobacterium brasiliense]